MSNIAHEEIRSMTTTGMGMESNFYRGNQQMHFLSQQAMDELFVKQTLRNQDANIKHGMMLEEQNFRLIMEEIKNENQIRRERALQKLKDNRENAVIKVFEDADEYLCMQTVYPDGSKIISNPIMKKSKLKMIKIISQRTYDCVAQWVLWEGQKREFILVANECNPKDFIKRLETTENAILVGRDRKRHLAELIYAYLVEHAEDRTLPDHYGWNKTKTGWIFVNEERLTIEGCLRRKI